MKYDLEKLRARVPEQFDDSNWPIVVLRFSEHSDDEEWRTLTDCLRACCHRRERFAVVADTSIMKRVPSALQRKIGADFAVWITETKPQPHWPIVAWGNVMTSQLVRGALTAILWLVSPPHPQRVFATAEEALAWVRAELAADRARA